MVTDLELKFSSVTIFKYKISIHLANNLALDYTVINFVE